MLCLRLASNCPTISRCESGGQYGGSFASTSRRDAVRYDDVPGGSLSCARYRDCRDGSTISAAAKAEHTGYGGW